LQTLLEQEPALQQSAERLQSISGVGVQATVRLTPLFSCIGYVNVNAVVAYSGLDPRPNDSGSKRGRRHLSKRGPALLRRQLYLVAFAASHSKAYGATYQKLRERLSTAEALVALARKLLRVAWAVWRSGQPFDASKIAGAMAYEKT
jgi:transposase